MGGTLVLMLMRWQLNPTPSQLKRLGACAVGVPGSAMGGTLVLAGRAKDTIVLSSGENIEPATLEDLVAASPFVAHAVIVGQDRRALGALIVPAEEAFEELASVRGGAKGLWFRFKGCGRTAARWARSSWPPRRRLGSWPPCAEVRDG